MQKVELLLSFYLLMPLWAALVKVAQQVRGSGAKIRDAGSMLRSYQESPH